MKVIEEYIKYIKEKKKLSNNTVSSYYIDIKKYTDYLNKSNLKLSDVVENDIISFIIELEKSNVSVSTISRMISSIKSFHDYLFRSHIIDTDPAKYIKKPKVEKQNLEILTEEEIESLLKFPNQNSSKSIRDKAIFEVLYGTGLRVSELIELNLEDVDLDLDYIYCNSEKNPRIIPILPITKQYLQKYITTSRCDLALNGEDALFVSSLGQRFTRQGLWKIIKKYAALANIDKNINPSMLRNSFAIHILKKGADISVVSKMLGNSNLSSLQGYLNHIDKNVRKEVMDKHPRK